ncbi:hypothetical protein Apa02nite_058660 [Actinoplanes palleronii]|uniref:Putative restriction endonuclease domain-containing protein n=2 Tax=Actinoplanes palleronii TaxID=113570 RepID=A0ABQ4BGE5_9ACTN|nr:hypothetical protein Apa02nite_058660 [Actinoplanes palleronii]
MSTCETLPMGKGTLDNHEGPWTEADWLALGETHERIELFDGSLLVTSANDYHNTILFNLMKALHPAARAAGLRAAQTPNVRLNNERTLIPDLAIKKSPITTAISSADEVVLVCEITSPSNAANDRINKMLAYAEAQIPWYLLIEPDFSGYESVALVLCRLESRTYIEHAAAKQGETLTSTLPFPLAISTEDLLAF